MKPRLLHLFVLALVAAARAADAPIDETLPDATISIPADAALVAICTPSRRSYVPLMARRRVILAAAVTSGGSIIPLMPSGERYEPPVDLEALADQVEPRRWFIAPSAGSAAMPATTTFPDATVVDDTGPDTGTRIDLRKVVLGACDNVGTLYSTTPFIYMKSEPLSPDRLEYRREAVLRLLRTRRTPGAESPRIVSTSARRISPDFQAEEIVVHIRPSATDNAYTVWGAFHRRRKDPLATIGAYRRWDDFTSVRRSDWARLDLGNGCLVGVVSYSVSDDDRPSGERLELIVMDSAGSSRRAMLAIDAVAAE